MNQTTLRNDEKTIFALRELYRKYGYSQYKMSKFEEYELYVRNKDFLISDNIITFTDTNGKLLALKPDVTLSIIKNSQDTPGVVQKVYYNENVYRVSSGTHAFNEIMQVGLECIGDIDAYCLYEVLCLAAQSLRCIRENGVLDISHLGILDGLLERFGVESHDRKEIWCCVGEKNRHELAAFCQQIGLSEEKTAVLQQLTALSGRPDMVLAQLRQMPAVMESPEPVEELAQLCDALQAGGYGDMIEIDFSVVSDSRYYNGVVFKGFVEGAADSVLSGGQYDRLMRRMGRRSGAIGFAVYMDRLQRLLQDDRGYDVDTVLLYDDMASVSTLQTAVADLAAQGRTVMAQRQRPEKIAYRCLARLCGNEVQILEENA